MNKAICFMLACLASSTSSAFSAYLIENTGVTPDGQFSYYDGNIHYWTGADGYSIYNTTSGITTNLGKPPGGVASNGFGDAFGVLDPATGRFYAGTYSNGGSSYVYTYDNTTGSWATPGPAGVHMVNAYGGAVHNSQLYVSGLAEPWNGGYGQANFIFAFDHSATPGGAAPRHDTLIETAGNSAYMTVAPNGDIYYATYSQPNTLYRWTAAQVASVRDDLYGGDVDRFLTLELAAEQWTLPGGGNGVAVDGAGNVFFAVNGPDSILGMLDSSQPGGYRTIYSSEGYMNWFGAISIEGNFLEGAPLYFSPTFGGGLLEITYVPEPSAVFLFAGGLTALAIRRRRL